MILSPLIYRRHRVSLDSEWHFFTSCDRWPETDYIQVVRVVDDTERLCQECARHESELFPAKRLRVGIIKLRDHPLMNYHGRSNWPPVWVNTRAEPATKLSGEVGTLTRTAYFPDTPKRLFLVMELEKEHYMGCLVFSEAGFCEQLSKILDTNAGRPIKDIGDLDLSHTL